MKCVVQRVRSASVAVNNEVVGAIDVGMLVLVGITHSDTRHTAEWMSEKLVSLRIFPDAEGKMNLSAKDIGGGILLVSQFTLYGDVKKGTRPSFIEAARPEHAEPLFNSVVDLVRLHCADLPSMQIATGVFGAMMDVQLVNDGPVTIILERN